MLCFSTVLVLNTGIDGNERNSLKNRKVGEVEEAEETEIFTNDAASIRWY